MQQAAFLSDSYRVRGPAEPSRWARVIDYAVLFSSMYPFAIDKLIHDRFIIENHVLRLPAILRSEALVTLAWLAFAVALALFTAKSIVEAREGRLNYTKTVLIALTVSVAFVIPSFHQLDVAFQGINVWHSFQYLAIIWLVNKQRKERGLISNRAVAKLSGADNTLRFYATLVGITALGGVVVLALELLTSLSTEQCYYIVVLGCLLVHYYFDTFLFTRAGLVIREQLAPLTGVWEWP